MNNYATAGNMRYYHCIFCGHALPIDEDGIIVHDDVPHDETATYDEEERPQ